jgi:hypothetical protein
MTNSISGDLGGQIRIATDTPLAETDAKPEVRVAADKAAMTPQVQVALAPPTGVAGTPGPAAGPAVALSPQDLPLIMRTLAEMVLTDIPIAQAAQTFLRAAVAANLPPAVVEQIQRMFAPLDAGLPAAELAAGLRASLAQSGLFTEHQLGAMLQEHSGALTADQLDAISDVRVLLGALTTAAATPVPDPVRVFGDALLQQQLVVAEQLAATGSGQMAIPVMFGDERVDIRFTWDREARQETQDRSQSESEADDDTRAISLGVFVNVRIFGGIEARLVWKPASFAVTFYVEREATRAIIDGGLSELSKELSASGFPAVATNVWLNPDRVAAGAAPVRRAIPAGTILDVMA